MVKKIFFNSLFGIVLFMLLVPSKSSELFSAIFRMESLMETHKYVADQLRAVIDEEQRFLDSIKRSLQLYEEEHRVAQNDINKYLGNPMNTFFLIKQLTVGLDDIQNMVNGSIERMTKFTLVKEGLQYPNEDDLTGAATALGRLQEFYKLNTTELAAGYINGEKIGRELSLNDCTYLARHLYNTDKYQLAISWMQEALRKYNQRDDVNVHSINEMLDFIAFSFYQLGDLESAREWTLKILNFEPNDLRASSNLKHYQRILHQRKQTQAVNKKFSNDSIRFVAAGKLPLKADIFDSETFVDSEDEKYVRKLESERYHAVCRGDLELLPNITKSLKCYYMDAHHPFLKIAPFKVEELYYYPKAYIVHNAVTDEEIDFIKNISIPQMTRGKIWLANGVAGYSGHRTSQISWHYDFDHPRLAVISRRTSHFTGLCTDFAEPLQVGNYGIGGQNGLHFDYDWMTRAKIRLANGVGGYSGHRTSQISWLYDADHPRLAVISRRTSHFTGLCTDFAEPLQVGNYGIGGQNGLHYDYDWYDYKETPWEDRFSTVLFYLSDVEQGGATGFLYLGLTVFPKKGSALVWHNLHPSGLGNELTRHGGCPVLLGDKWVANKWVSSTGQEQRWPCHLDREYGLDVHPLPIRLKLP